MNSYPKSLEIKLARLLHITGLLRIFGTLIIGGVALYIVFQNRHLSEETNPSKSVLTVERVTPNVYTETNSRLYRHGSQPPPRK